MNINDVIGGAIVFVAVIGIVGNMLILGVQ